MKQMWIGLISAATLLSANGAVAQSSKPVSIGVAAGAAIPTGTLGDSWSTGYNVTGIDAKAEFGGAMGGVVNILTTPGRSGFSANLQGGDKGLFNAALEGSWKSGALSVDGAKTDDTRVRRVQKVIDALHA